MAGKRNGYGIQLDILNAIKKKVVVEGKAGKTRVMQEINLDSRSSKYIENVVERGLVEEMTQKRGERVIYYYKLTDRGEEALKPLGEALNTLKEYLG